MRPPSIAPLVLGLLLLVATFFNALPLTDIRHEYVSQDSMGNLQNLYKEGFQSG